MKYKAEHEGVSEGDRSSINLKIQVKYPCCYTRRSFTVYKTRKRDRERERKAFCTREIGFVLPRRIGEIFCRDCTTKGVRGGGEGVAK